MGHYSGPVPVPAPKPWRRPPPDPVPLDLDDEASALDLIDQIRGLRLNGAENFEVWLQQRADAEYAASLLIAHAGLTDDTRSELDREVTLLRRQANPPTSGARVWTRSDDRISSASEVDDPRLAEARAYDLVDRMRSLRLNGAAAGRDLHRERSSLLSQGELLLTTASLRPATRQSLSTEVRLLVELSDEVVSEVRLADEAEPVAEPETELGTPPDEKPETEPETELTTPPEVEVDTPPEMARPGFWRRLSHRLTGRSGAGHQ